MNYDPPLGNPDWLSVEDVTELHREGLRFGGEPGLHIEKLEAAVNRPRQLATYEDPTLFECAARYGYAIARAHAFIDGNKRTAALTVRAFLYRHEYKFYPDQNEMIEMFKGIAEGSIKEEEFKEWIQENTEPVSDLP